MSMMDRGVTAAYHVDHVTSKIDQREQARAELSAAITLYCTMETAFWLPQAEAALAQMV